jgi:glycosyltransferase involved in cell wall biosynthesis
VDPSSEVPKSGTVNFLYYLYLLTIFRLYVALVTARIISKNKLDVVFERETSFGAGALASYLTGKELILEIIGPRYSKMSASRSKKIFYYTEEMLRDWVDRDKCELVPAGVNLTLFHVDEDAGRERRLQLRLEADALVLGYVGTFQEWHGVQDLVASVARLKTELPFLRALLVGPNCEKFKSLSEREGASELCVFTGAVEYDSVPSYVNACDIMFALYNPNADELRKKYGIGWPIKILEYMACEKPVVSTNVEPIYKLIRDESLGLLVEPGRPDEVATAVESLAKDEKKRREIGLNGRSLVERNYSWRSVAETIASAM